ncbi:heterokaryon incompatibility protein-domain-containing protein, partial [Leptodontidium sp. 2 PMI_412]
CLHEHGYICETPLNQDPDLTGGPPKDMPVITGMRVIDCQEMCIVDAPPSCRFVALSYVWGKLRVLLLLKENRHLSEQPKALEREVLPKTVQESILLTRMLGERYLWVDALCIVQDDDSLKIPQITQMDKIYLSAALTIVSAGGDNAHAGLAGLMPNSRENKQDVENIAGIRFVSISSKLPWNLPKMK